MIYKEKYGKYFMACSRITMTWAEIGRAKHIVDLARLRPVNISLTFYVSLTLVQRV